jgi:hypothetical protein
MILRISMSTVMILKAYARDRAEVAAKHHVF